MRTNRAPGSVELKPVRVLSVSPNSEDHVALGRMLAVTDGPIAPALIWSVRRATTVESATALLDNLAFDVLVCEEDLAPGNWRHVLRYLSTLLDPPLFVVTSRRADEYLWAEALNLGAWDVLAKPLDPGEVVRVLRSASVHRNEQKRMRRRSVACAQG